MKLKCFNLVPRSCSDKSNSIQILSDLNTKRKWFLFSSCISISNMFVFNLHEKKQVQYHFLGKKATLEDITILKIITMHAQDNANTEIVFYRYTWFFIFQQCIHTVVIMVHSKIKLVKCKEAVNDSYVFVEIMFWWHCRPIILFCMELSLKKSACFWTWTSYTK